MVGREQEELENKKKQKKNERFASLSEEALNVECGERILKAIFSHKSYIHCVLRGAE